jgi:hypothetical protein
LAFGLQRPKSKLCIFITFNETTNAERYQRLIFEPFINQMELANGYFQQDAAIAHTARTLIIREINYGPIDEWSVLATPIT